MWRIVGGWFLTVPKMLFGEIENMHWDEQNNFQR